MINTDKEVFSTDEEQYSDDIDWIKEKIEDEGIEIVYVANRVNFEHSDFINIDWLIDDMQDRAYEVAGEWAESYLDGFTKETKKELEVLICNFLTEKMSEPSFFTVKDVKQISKNDFYLKN